LTGVPVTWIVCIMKNGNALKDECSMLIPTRASAPLAQLLVRRAQKERRIHAGRERDGGTSDFTQRRAKTLYLRVLVFTFLTR